jgi:hypothetical protein
MKDGKVVLESFGSRLVAGLERIEQGFLQKNANSQLGLKMP